MQDSILFSFFWILNCQILHVNASLVIIETTYPWYFHEGETLTLVCEDDTRTTLTWNRKTAGTSWVDVPINPVAGSNFSTASCSEEPAGKTGNTLSKTSLTLADRGTFKCSNTRSETYAVYINVLSVYATRNITDNRLLIQCRILGFDANPPSYIVRWTYRTSNVSSPNEIPSSGRYNITSNNGFSQLLISQIAQKDAGMYNCSFYFATNADVVSYSSSIVINDIEVANLGRVTSAAKLLLVLCILTYAFCLITT